MVIKTSGHTNSSHEVSFTVVTVCLNSRHTIARTIQSVLDQKTADVEYIVVDGGSADGTQEVVRAFGDSIDTFISEPDNGIADAFNKGISMSHGTIISLINSDDRLLPGALQQVRDYFIHNPESQVVHAEILLHHGDQLVKRVTPAGRWWYPWRLVLFNHPATFVKRSVYEVHGMFSTDFRIAMDIDIFTRWSTAGVKIDYMPTPLVAMHYGGVSDRHPFAGYKEAMTAFIRNGYPIVPVFFLYATKCLLHRVGKLHAALLAYLRN